MRSKGSGKVLSESQKLRKCELSFENDLHRAYSNCHFIDIKHVNKEREKKGKKPKYKNLTFQTTYGDCTIVYGKHYSSSLYLYRA